MKRKAIHVEFAISDKKYQREKIKSQKREKLYNDLACGKITVEVFLRKLP